MNTPGIIERWQLRRPEMLVAVVAGIAVGGWAGATFRGSGMFYSNLILGGCLLLLLALAGLGALAAALTHRTRAAGALAAFSGMALIATGVAYTIAPPYRSADAPFKYRGNATLRIAEYSATEWRAEAVCATRERETSVTRVSAQDVKIGDRWVSVDITSNPGASSFQADVLTIGSYSPTERSRDFAASSGTGLDATTVGADGLTGSVRFSAILLPNPYRLQDPEFSRLTGTFAWACESMPSG